MARAIALAGLLLAVTAGTARALEEDIEAAAAQAEIDPVELAGAVNTTGLEPLDYLYKTGHLAPPVQIPPPPVPIASVWTRLAQCESTGNWRANTGNGYYGGLQADMTFWRRHGGLAYAPRPDLATPAQQVAVAQRGQAAQGWGAWPVCSRRIGLR